jgi:hypothetical protein
MAHPEGKGGSMRRLLRENGLAITMFGLFLASLIPMSISGHRSHNADLRDHRRAPITYVRYLWSGDFVEGVFENWESEFLQMGSFVLLTVWLSQKGSPESKEPQAESPQDADPRRARNPDRPWPVRRGGVVLKVYEHSLALALFLLFFGSFAMHAIGGAAAFNESQRAHGGRTVSTIGFVGTSEFWYQSFQNWQSEFLSVGGLTVLAIFLRQRGSPESKPVAAPHRKTGE